LDGVSIHPVTKKIQAYLSNSVAGEEGKQLTLKQLQSLMALIGETEEGSTML
jgi:hypothetical protein